MFFYCRCVPTDMSLDSADSNIVVYTAIFGDYDVLIDPKVIESGVDYVCFTDDETLTSDVWEIRNVTPMIDSALSNRRIKILTHEYLEEYDISVYIDGNIQILERVEPLVEDYLSTADFALYKHPKRTSVFEEGKSCIEQNKAEAGSVCEQLKHYRDAGFPDDRDLSENRILFRRHQNPEIKDLMWSWWREVSERASRDQLSLMFVLWKHDLEYNLIPHSVRDAPQFAIHPHRPDGYLGSIWPYWMSIRTDPDPGLLKNTGFYFERSLSVLKNEGFLALLSKLTSLLVRTLATQIKEIGDRLGVIGPDQIYSDEYYAKRRQDPFRSESHEIADALVERFQPSSVIDYGCAIGTYLERFEEHGVTINGVEGNSAAFRHAVVPNDRLEQHDLRQPYEPDDYYDLVLSVEVAEHIPERYARTFVNTLAKSGEVVVLTAAPPGQGGTHHVNEKPPEYWIQLFDDHGMEYDRETTDELKEEIVVDSLYHVPENIMVFKKTDL